MRVFTVLGPSGAGKTTLVQALASLDDKRGKSLTVPGVATVSSFSFMGEDWAAVDVVGGAENLASVGAALAASDIAVICVPADAESAVLAAPFIRRVEELGVPSIIFINRIDAAQNRIAEIVSALQAYSRHHIVLREVPIREGGTITGFVDLVSERAWKFEEGRHSVMIEMPDSVKDREAAARTELLESYADLDDHLMEELIEDHQPVPGEVYAVAAKALRENAVIECFIGSASKRHGITRLMKSLRHDAPGVEVARGRFDGAVAVGALADQFKHLGKVVLLRALDGVGGGKVGGADVGSITDLDAKTGLGQLAAGQIGLAVKSDHLSAGQVFSRDKGQRLPDVGAVQTSPFRRILTPEHDKDDSRLLVALNRLCEIDPALGLSSDEASGRPVLATQGPLHLRRLLAKIAGDFGIPVGESPVPTALRETIQRGTEIHHRHRKQTGGAGQFADVVIEVRPEARGSGFAFTETVKGGTVPRNYIPSVEEGARDGLAKGPLGHPVVDVSVELKDGKSHAVDSSDHAFRTAGKSAIREALDEVGTVLLQPVMKAEIHVPSIYSGALVPLVSGLKGQVLGFEAHESAAGWDVFQLLLPMASEDALFVALAAATRGTAWFTSGFDHYEVKKDDSE
ncbi:elongation factor G [Tabrizicola sp.]|uniref:elongation factor G n=1 Tax=Tabrizicola sp. TaxID=2005166 RepID=UPI001A4057E9|nr:elongation factor G [Tabrizicola sp.]MBL9072998.1 elongation factor G [Tabrizicola sp.]